MSSREIIIRLINEHLVSGEEAFILINDIVASEMQEALELLNESKKETNSYSPLKYVDWNTTTTSPGTINIPSTWNTITCNNDLSTSTVCSTDLSQWLATSKAIASDK